METSTRPRASDDSRSADPLPCATHTPERFDVGDERDERDQVAGRRAVDVVTRVGPLSHAEVQRQQVRLATSEQEPHVVGVDERPTVLHQLVEHARAAVGG